VHFTYLAFGSGFGGHSISTEFKLLLDIDTAYKLVRTILASAPEASQSDATTVQATESGSSSTTLKTPHQGNAMLKRFVTPARNLNW
jgi:hypothetical protein